MDSKEMPIVDGYTRLFGIIGHPIGQVKSPAVFTERLRKLGMNALLLPFHAEPDRFDDVMRGLMAMANVDGILVTVPYKTSVAAYVDNILPAASRSGAINAMRREKNGTWSADMFDGKGCVGGLRGSGVDPKDKSFMLLGAGGAGSAIADALGEAGAASITIFDTSSGKGEKLAALIGEHHPSCRVKTSKPTVEGIDVLINATPTGMAPGDGLPVNFGKFDPKLFVVEIIPKPDITPLVTFARECGCKTMLGQAMVAGQADAIVQFLRGN
jgi:shikimate dehydrogenase